MKARDKRTILRVCGVLLLLLACSPFTAPFSTIDPVEIFGGAASDGGTVPQSKHSQDGPATLQAALSGLVDCATPTIVTAPELLRAAGNVSVFRIPLRI